MHGPSLAAEQTVVSEGQQEPGLAVRKGHAPTGWVAVSLVVEALPPQEPPLQEPSPQEPPPQEPPPQEPPPQELPQALVVAV